MTEEKKSKNKKLARNILIIFVLLAVLSIGALWGFISGYKQGLNDMAHTLLSMVGKVNINGNVTVSINETKLDQALTEMQNITINLINQSLTKKNG